MIRRFIVGLIALVVLCAFNGSVHTAQAREYRILAIRVDFPYEEPDHDTTSGRGAFEMGNYYTDETVRQQYFHPWDIPPHDSLYFAHHLEALNNYWSTVSEGRVSITFDILPRNTAGAYTMSNKFYKYGNGRTDNEINEKLVGLFKEAVETCKREEGGSIDFADYDTFMIIHAGIGQETSGGLNDILSAYLSPEDFRIHLGGLLTIDGAELDNGIIVPEAASFNGVGGLNGIMTQMFGHRLGLPSLSNNADGIPGAGGWCLMDTGSMSWGYNTRGFVPTHPCAWSKIELGWIEPVVVTTDTTLDITATHILSGAPRAVKIPITGDEYLLLENRLRYASRDSLPSAVFSDTDTSGVWMSVDHYDTYIPGSGLLIWHVNEKIIRERREDNAINNDPLRRGIDLLEADGQQDIGAMFGFGDERAEYSEGHDDDTYKLSGVNILSPTTNPNSGSMWGGNSGVTVQVNSDPGEVMNVTIRFSGNLKGFPVSLGKEGTVTAADIIGGDGDELIVKAGNDVSIFSSQGTRIDSLQSYFHPPTFRAPGTNKQGLITSIRNEMWYIIQKNDLFKYNVNIWDTFSNYSIKYEDMLTVDNQDGTTSGILFGREIYDKGDTKSSFLNTINDIYNSTPRQNYTFPDTVHVKSMAAAQYDAAVLTDDNVLYLGNVNDARFTSYQLGAGSCYGPVMADIDRDGTYETIVATENKMFIYNPDGSYDSVTLYNKPTGEPALADIDGDGYPEIVLCTEKAVHAFTRTGIPVNGFPYRLPPGDSNERITTPPVVADLDGDGDTDIAFCTSDMRVLSYDGRGAQTAGFPLATNGAVEQTPCIFRLDDGSLALAYVTTGGTLMAHALSAPANDNSLPWSMRKGGPGLASSLLNSEIPSDIRTTAPFKAYCYPNPITKGAGTFRITLPERSDCTITVYSADGRKVFEQHVPENSLTPGVPNEIRMDASKLASGLYIARIKTRKNAVNYKLGVLR